MLRELTINDFTSVLGEGKATPGGGAAAALSASLAAALTSMVFNLTIDKKAAKDYPESVVTSMKEAREATDRFRNRYLKLMVDDAESFDGLMAAFSLPKETEEEKAQRKSSIDSAKERVLEIPYQLVKESFEMYDALKIATEYGNKNAISDAGVAAILIHSAIEGAALNVFINLAGSEVNEENISLKAQTDDYVEKSKSFKEDIVATVIDKIYGRQ
ncbi:cyclodeaminase/cyclohydrolase family protein [Proteiniclasticum sp. SCR006]|uniref:Cyclodeaminase/cyclohydrolase family protein n=1 Tax=Proteiniclasticum aestuarii TaxID=2817862 RepID=A0A939H870_9CLOT|nr:cyclodeaminase/cyclohydrolase family protein [Proteiniclasticum aestuarii]MBO1263778.1 cyclodeaminase/cyclohydrolase family protein [Proteiniclasticum aestuarii]